jgi:L-ribulose-5-phosphate 3-epimerase
VPLGHGDMDWTLYLGALEEIEYRGWLTIACDSGGNRVADVATGVSFLRRLVGPQE